MLMAALLLPGLVACDRSGLKPWHTELLSLEFTADQSDQAADLEAYLAIEDAVFGQLDERIYAQTPSGVEYALMRYSPDSAADPRQRSPDWNRSFILHTDTPRGAVLLLHGMSDSPYSLRALGLALHRAGYEVLGLRLPGHGTAPSGMTTVQWQDMAAAVRLGVSHLRDVAGDAPLHMVGYSTGAALALDFVLQTEQPEEWPASLVLISPAIGITRAAGLAQWKRRLSLLPGLGDLAWTQVELEFDPYKYNSFATNAGEQVHLLTRSVVGRIDALARSGQEGPLLPPTLVLKSTVDATVSTEAGVHSLLQRLSPHRHELVLFDVNRFAPTASLMVADPGPLSRSLFEDDSLRFALTLVANDSLKSRAVSALHKPPFTAGVTDTRPLSLQWPVGVFSLSHVALPFNPTDPLYGAAPPDDQHGLFLGQQALQGERGILAIPPTFLLRIRYNPFYAYLEERVFDWLAGAE
jgi:esterase/lipase